MEGFGFLLEVCQETSVLVEFSFELDTKFVSMPKAHGSDNDDDYSNDDYGSKRNVCTE